MLPLKGHSQLWDRADLDTCFSHFEKSSPQPEIKVHLEIHYNLRSVLLDFQSFTEKPVFECDFAHPMILFLSYLVKNSMDRVSVICKLAKKWYLMRMCFS